MAEDYDYYKQDLHYHIYQKRAGFTPIAIVETVYWAEKIVAALKATAKEIVK